MSSQPEIPAGLADVPVAKSAISIIDGRRALLSYRGIPVEQLAKESSFEETAWLLLKGNCRLNGSLRISTTICGRGGSSTTS